MKGRVAVQIAGFLTGIILARSLGVEGRGLVAAILFAPQLVITIAEFGVRNAAAYLIGRNEYPVAKIVETILASAILTASLGSAACLGWLLLTWQEGYTPLLIAIACTITPGAVVYTYCAGVFLGLQRIPDFALVSWVPGVSKCLLTLVLVFFLGGGVTGAIAAAAGASVLVAGLMLWRLIATVPTGIAWHGEIFRRLASMGSSYALVYFLMEMVHKINIVLVQAFADLEALGHYALGSNLAELMWQIPAVISAIVFTRAASAKDGKRFAKQVAMLTRIALLVTTLAAGFVWLVAPFVIPLLYGGEFAQSADILRALLPGVGAMVVFKILRQDLSGRGRPWAAAWIMLPMLAAAVALGALVIPSYGAIGAAWSMSSVFAAGTIGFAVLYCRQVELPFLELICYRRSDFEFLAPAWKRLKSKLTSG